MMPPRGKSFCYFVRDFAVLRRIDREGSRDVPHKERPHPIGCGLFEKTTGHQCPYSSAFLRRQMSKSKLINATGKPMAIP